MNAAQIAARNTPAYLNPHYTPSDDLAADPNGTAHLAFGPCDSTTRRVHLGFHAETGRDLGYAASFGHAPCGALESPVEFVKSAHSSVYYAYYRCEEHAAAR